MIKGLKNMNLFLSSIIIIVIIAGDISFFVSVALLAACFSLCRCLAFRTESLHLSNAELNSSSGGQTERISSLKKVKIGQYMKINLYFLNLLLCSKRTILFAFFKNDLK